MESDGSVCGSAVKTVDVVMTAPTAQSRHSPRGHTRQTVTAVTRTLRSLSTLPPPHPRKLNIPKAHTPTPKQQGKSTPLTFIQQRTKIRLTARPQPAVVLIQQYRSLIQLVELVFLRAAGRTVR